MGTPVRASGSIEVLGVEVSPTAVRITLRAYDVNLKPWPGESDTPVATLIKSGALDLSKPGNLVKFLPKRPAVIVDAEGDRLVLDLLKAPKLANNPNFRKRPRRRLPAARHPPHRDRHEPPVRGAEGDAVGRVRGLRRAAPEALTVARVTG